MDGRVEAPGQDERSLGATAQSHGSLTNFSFPAGFSVLASKVRISVAPPMSSVTTSRSPAMPVATMRAPLGKHRGGLGGDDASLGAEKTVADGDQDGRDRQRRGQAGDQHHPPHPREKHGLFGGRFGRNSLGHAGLFGDELIGTALP